MRLIDADLLKLNDFEILLGGSYKGLLQILLEKIEDAPTIDAEPVRHGHWIGVSQTNMTILEKLFFPSRVFKCSVCGNYLDFDGVNFGRGSANFCPNCQSKMDERGEDEQLER